MEADASSPNFSVVFSEKLILQLIGPDPSHPQPRQRPPSRAAQLESPHALPAREAPANGRLGPPVHPGGFPPALARGLGVPGRAGSVPPEAQLGQSDIVAIRQALRKSERVGDLLLKAEEQELEKVKGMAAELIEKQYRPPPGTIPCAAERDTCVQCYLNHAESPLACAEAVRTFTECSRRAQQEFAQNIR